ncbi:hypothetical protein E4U15_007483 [Claviceps sp. LM218 group G6]|nr:hypothetical protein E4U15_007483 [Claviceps sp. LM218 group G6]
MSVERDMVENVLNQIAVLSGSDPRPGGRTKLGVKPCTQRETVNCTSSTGGTLSMSALECDTFRASILYVKDANACHRCGISQKLCNTREAGSLCQWPRIAPAILRLATANDAGREIITKAGYIGEMNDWEAYALWLGQKHSQRRATVARVVANLMVQTTVNPISSNACPMKRSARQAEMVLSPNHEPPRKRIINFDGQHEFKAMPLILKQGFEAYIAEYTEKKKPEVARHFEVAQD